jgi:hypothetical protein
MEDIARLRHGGSCEVGAWRLVWLHGGEDGRGGMDAPGAHCRSLISSIGYNTKQYFTLSTDRRWRNDHRQSAIASSQSCHVLMAHTING